MRGTILECGSSLAERKAYPMALAIESRSVGTCVRQCYFQYSMDARTGPPPASLPITTVHPPAWFIASAFKNASFLSLKNLLSGISAICAPAFPFPLMSPRGGWDEVFLRPSGFGTRLISGPKAPLILFKALITVPDFCKWSANKVVADHFPLCTSTPTCRQMFGDAIATLRRMGPRQVLSLPKFGLPAFLQT